MARFVSGYSEMSGEARLNALSMVGVAFTFTLT